MTNHCTHEQSLALKEIGFDIPTRDYYDKSGNLCNHDGYFWNYNQKNLLEDITSAPTHSEVLQWAREKKGIHGEVSILEWDKEYAIWYYIKPEAEVPSLPEFYPSWDEAESALVNKIIEIIKEKKA